MYRHYLPEQVSQVWRNDGMADVQLAVSRDGISWKRYRQPYVELGLDGTTDQCSGTVFMAQGMIRRGNELMQFYWGGPVTYGQKPKNENSYNLYYTLQRLDGFVSASAGNDVGSIVTKPLIFNGNNLKLNVDTSALGQLQVAILDSNEMPIPGFSLADADLIQGNYIEKIATWKGLGDTRTLAGRSVRIKFVMQNAKLFAFQFAD
jgi:hypothetical protein